MPGAGVDYEGGEGEGGKESEEDSREVMREGAEGVSSEC